MNQQTNFIADLVLNQEETFFEYVMTNYGTFRQRGFNFIIFGNIDMLVAHLETVPKEYRFRLWIHAHAIKPVRKGQAGPLESAASIKSRYPHIRFQYISRDAGAQIDGSQAFKILDLIRKTDLKEFPVNSMGYKDVDENDLKIPISFNSQNHDIVGPNVDLVVISALQEEFVHFENLMKVVKTETLGPYEVRMGTLSKTNNETEHMAIKVAGGFQIDMGMVDCSILATAMIIRFRPRYIALIGVCGGRQTEGVEIGDLIVPKKAFAYQRGKISSKGFEYELVSAQIEPDLHRYFENEAAKAIFPPQVVGNWNRQLGNRSQRIPKVYFETMASGELVINSPGKIEEIAHQDRKTVGLDMESYGFLRSVQLLKSIYKTDGIVIKGVMDLTENKGDKHKTLAAFLSANYLRELVLNVLKFD